MTQEPHDPTKPWPPAPQQYAPPTQSYGPPVTPGYPQQPYGAPPMQAAPPGAEQQYVAWPPPVPPKSGWGTGKVILAIVGGVFALCMIGVIGSVMNRSSDTPTAAAKKQPMDAGSTAKAPAPPADEAADDSGGDTGGGKTFDLKMGTTLTITADDGSVAETTLSNVRLHKGACGEFGADPDNGYILIADVVVVQKSGTGSVNDLDFTFVADDGNTSSALSGAFSNCAKRDLNATNDLRPGTKRAGQISFDVASAKGSIEYAPGGFGASTVGSWKTG